MRYVDSGFAGDCDSKSSMARYIFTVGGNHMIEK